MSDFNKYSVLVFAIFCNSVSITAQVSDVSLPFPFSGNLGRRTSFFECGVGGTLLFDHPEKDGISYIILGYRLALPVKRRIAFAFRIKLDIPLNYRNVVGEGDPQFIPAGLGLGISF